MKINIIRPFLPKIEDIYEDFSDCLDSGMVTNNSMNVRNLEEKLHNYLNSKLPPILFCNGELALFSLIQAYKLKLGFSPHDSFDVIVPSFTFSGTLNAILMNNLRPVFCDIDESLTIDISKCNTINKNIKMIVAVGAYGNLSNIETLRNFADKNKLALIFDNAPAFGSKYKGEYTHHYGYSEIYSFHASKIFNTMEGGMVITNDETTYHCLVKLRDFGQYEKIRGNVDVPGLNSKMQEISAIIGLKNLDRIDFILNSRNENIKKYRRFFEDENKKEIFNTMKISDDVVCTFLYYPIILPNDSTDFVHYLHDKNIMVRRYYTAAHDLDLYAGQYDNFDLSFTNKIKNNVVAIPIHTLMTNEETDYLFDTINEYFKL